MPLIFEDHFTVLNSESDPWLRMTPGSILRRVQDISIAQCEAKGLNDEMYQKTGTTFLLAKLSLLVFRAPCAGEAIRLETRAYGMRRALYHRVTSLHGPGGEKLCEADSRWVLVNTNTRRIMRQPPEEFAHIYTDAPGAEEHDLNFPKAGHLEPLANLTAAYTQCDSNGHLNNTKYADLVCNQLPLELLREGLPRRMLLGYHNEIPLGGCFLLSGSTTEPDSFLFSAEGENGVRHFECFVQF